MSKFLVLFDVCKLAPTVGWLIMCIAAVPRYAAVGWTAPIVCAVFSSVMAVAATRDIYQHLTPSLHATLLAAPLLGPDAPPPPPPKHLGARAAELKLGIAALFSVTSVALTVAFLAIAYGPIASEKESMPCDGKCEGCAIDPDCAAWVAAVEAKHSSTAICPPATASYVGDVTFSCLADGFWMLVTSLVGFIWLGATVTILRAAKRLHAEADPEASSGVVISTKS